MPPLTLANAFGGLVQRWMSDQQRADTLALLRSIDIRRRQVREFLVAEVLNDIEEYVEAEGRERFNAARTQVELLELGERIGVLRQALATSDGPPSEESPPLPSNPPMPNVHGNTSSNPSSSLGNVSSPRRQRGSNEQGNQDDQSLSSVSFAGSQYSLFRDILNSLEFILDHLPDAFVAEQIRQLTMARNDAPGEDLGGNSDAAATFYLNFRQSLEAQDVHQQLGGHSYRVPLLFAALDGLKRISTRFAHVREILIRTDADAGTVLSRPNYPTGTEVGSAFD